MAKLVLTTFDWVPDMPRGYVRDLRIRWALEEAGLPYSVESTSFKSRGAEHFAHQPFGQVPWLTHGEISLFESGAILHYLGHLGEGLLPRDDDMRLTAIEWLFAALNSVEMASLPWSLFVFSGDDSASPMRKQFDAFVHSRLHHLEPILAKREWMAGTFSVADIAMADVLRLLDRFGALADYAAARTYLDRATARPAFRKALADQMAHFAAAD